MDEKFLRRSASIGGKKFKFFRKFQCLQALLFLKKSKKSLEIKGVDRMSLIDSWLSKLQSATTAAPRRFTFADGIFDPGLGVAGEAILPDECYIEIYVESLRLKHARKLASRFDGVVYVFAGLAQEGQESAKLASVTKPKELGNLDADGDDKIITLETHMLGPTPWRGGGLDLEIGLFSVKKSDILTPWLDYVTQVAETSGVSFVGQAKPFLGLIRQGLDLLSGQTKDCVIEVGLATRMKIETSRICAIIAEEEGSIDRSGLSLGRDNRTLLLNGVPLDAGYCVFSIRCTKQRVDWGQIPELRAAFAELMQAIRDKKKDEREPVETAFWTFQQAVRVSPDLIQSDRQRLVHRAKEQFVDPTLSGVQPISRGGRPINPMDIELTDLNLYDA